MRKSPGNFLQCSPAVKLDGHYRQASGAQYYSFELNFFIGMSLLLMLLPRRHSRLYSKNVVEVIHFDLCEFTTRAREMGTFWLISKADESQKGKLYMYVINAPVGHNKLCAVHV